MPGRPFLPRELEVGFRSCTVRGTFDVLALLSLKRLAGDSVQFEEHVQGFDCAF